MSQSTLFDVSPPLTAPVARQREEFARTHAKRNQSTSREAAERVAPVAMNNVQHATECVNLWPGCTSAELAEKSKTGVRIGVLTGGPLDRTEIARRLPDALDDRLVRKGPKRKCKVGRGNAETWWPAEFSDSDIQREMSNGRS